MTIKSLTSIDSFSDDDSIPLYQEKNEDTRRGTVALLVEHILSSGNLSSKLVSQYASPTTGSTVSITDSSDNAHLILTPAGTLATLTVQLPAVASVVDKQEIVVTSTQIITALTVDINGATNIFGAPTTLTAGGFFKLKYDAVLSNWNRVG